MRVGAGTRCTKVVSGYAFMPNGSLALRFAFSIRFPNAAMILQNANS